MAMKATCADLPQVEPAARPNLRVPSARWCLRPVAPYLMRKWSVVQST